MTRWATLAIGLLAFCSFPVPVRRRPSPATAGSRCSTARTSIIGRATAPPTSRSRTARSSAMDKKDPKATRPILVSKDISRTSNSAPSSGSATTPTAASSSAAPTRRSISSKTCYECNIFDTRPDPSYGTGAIVDVAEVDPCPRPAASGTPWRSPPRARFTLMFNGKKTASAATACTPKGHRAAIRRGHGEVPQGRYQAAVIASARAACASLFPCRRGRRIRSYFVIGGGKFDCKL